MRILLLAIAVLCSGSVIGYAAGDTANQADTKSVKAHKEDKNSKDKNDNKHKDEKGDPIQVPDGDGGTALLLIVGVGTLVALAKLRERNLTARARL